MASITKTASGWRVQLFCRGIRASSSFRTKAEAAAWAATKENEIRSGQVPEGYSKPKKKRPLQPEPQDVSPLKSKAAILAAAREATLFPAVYFLIKDGEIMYVGETTNIFWRIASHLLVRQFDSFSYIPCKKERLRKLEARYIQEFQPVWNYTGRVAPEDEVTDGVIDEAGELLARTDICEGATGL